MGWRRSGVVREGRRGEVNVLVLFQRIEANLEAFFPRQLDKAFELIDARWPD
jgi:hypothetical protein